MHCPRYAQDIITTMQVPPGMMSCVDCAECKMQDVPQLARLLLTVLVEDSLRLRLAAAARATALQFAPSVIADRCELTHFRA